MKHLLVASSCRSLWRLEWHTFQRWRNLIWFKPIWDNICITEPYCFPLNMIVVQVYRHMYLVFMFAWKNVSYSHIYVIYILSLVYGNSSADLLNTEIQQSLCMFRQLWLVMLLLQRCQTQQFDQDRRKIQRISKYISCQQCNHHGAATYLEMCPIAEPFNVPPP